MAKVKKTHSIKIYLRFVTIFPIAFFIVTAAVITILTMLYTKSDNSAYLIALIASSAFLVALYAVYTFYVTKQFRHVFVKGLFRTTMKNFENIVRNESNFVEYPNQQYEEIVALNNHIDVLRRELNGATLIPSESSYANLELEYVDIKKHIVTFESFKKELENIIFVSQNYRNVLIEVYYELGDEILTPKDTSYLFGVLRENFNDYQNVLYAVSEDKKSVYVYLPRIDTLSKINEQL